MIALFCDLNQEKLIDYGLDIFDVAVLKSIESIFSYVNEYGIILENDNNHIWYKIEYDLLIKQLPILTNIGKNKFNKHLKKLITCNVLTIKVYNGINFYRFGDNAYYLKYNDIIELSDARWIRKVDDKYKISAVIRKQVWDKDNGECFYCGKELNPFAGETSIDHKISKYNNGSNDIDNLVLSCRTCNSSKGIKNIDEYRNYLKNKNNNFSGIFHGELILG